MRELSLLLMSCALFVVSTVAHASTTWSKRIAIDLKEPLARVVIRTPQPLPEDAENYRFLGEVAPGKLVYEGGPTGPDGASQRIHLEVSALRSVFQPRRAIALGEQVQAAEFDRAEVDVLRGIARQWRSEIVSDLGDQAWETKWRLSPGQPLLQSQLQKLSVIRRGETLKLQVTTGDISVTTTARAEQNGAVGDVIRVTSLKTRKEFSGRIAEPGRVEVSL